MSHELGFFQNVGMSAHYSTKCSGSDLRALIYNALALVLREHTILSAIPVDEHSADVHFSRLEYVEFLRCVFFKTRSQPSTRGEDDNELDAILTKEHNTDFKTEYGTLPFWRLIILQDGETERSFTASFIYYHGIGDGIAGLIFHKSFLDALNAVTTGSTTMDQGITKIKISPDGELLPPLEELHPLPLNLSTTSHRADGLTEWTGNPIELPSTTHFRSLYFSTASSTKFSQKCKANGVSVTSGLQAALAGAMFEELPSSIDALTGIIPINLRPWLNMPKDVAKRAIGSFIDAIKVQLRRSDYACDDDLAAQGLSAARHTSTQIEKYLTGSPSPSGEPYTSVASFKAIPDVSLAFKSMVGTNRDAAFEISNLGKFGAFTEPDDGSQWCLGRITFSRSAVAFGAALTTSVVTGGDGALTVGFSWQNGVVDDDFVDQVADNFKKHFTSEAF